MCCAHGNAEALVNQNLSCIHQGYQQHESLCSMWTTVPENVQLQQFNWQQALLRVPTQHGVQKGLEPLHALWQLRGGPIFVVHLHHQAVDVLAALGRHQGRTRA